MPSTWDSQLTLISTIKSRVDAISRPRSPHLLRQQQKKRQGIRRASSRIKKPYRTYSGLHGRLGLLSFIRCVDCKHLCQGKRDADNSEGKSYTESLDSKFLDHLGLTLKVAGDMILWRYYVDLWGGDWSYSVLHEAINIWIGVLVLAFFASHWIRFRDPSHSYYLPSTSPSVLSNNDITGAC